MPYRLAKPAQKRTGFPSRSRLCICQKFSGVKVCAQLNESPSDATINRGLACIRIPNFFYKHYKYPVIHASPGLWIQEIQITQNALKHDNNGQIHDRLS